jgi:signal transduction histidine kinase
VPINRQKVNINCLVEEVVRQIGSSPDYAGVRFETEVSENEIYIRGDSGRLRQVLINLFSNSRKASASVIRASLYRDGGMAVIDITDNGKGVDPKDQPYIFERFYRGFPGKDSKHGLGLGLTISRLLVRAHGGELVLLRTGNGETAFRIQLPQKDMSLG